MKGRSVELGGTDAEDNRFLTRKITMKADFDLIIEPGRSIKNYWKDLWRFRELF